MLLSDWTQLNAAANEPVGMAVVNELTDGEEIVHVFGEVDLSNAHELELAIAKAGNSDGSVAVDFRSCQYIDTSVLTVLVRAHKALGARFRIITSAQGNVGRLLRITKIDTVLSVETVPAPAV